MKLQVAQNNLARALNTVARIASNRGTLPVLANVLLKTENNRLNISATNLDIAITHFVGSKITSDGAITVPAKLMQDLISSLPEGIINLELEENHLKITTDQYQSVINGIPAEDFPVMPAISQTATWKVPAVDFKKALARVVFAASSDDARPVLTGVNFHSDDTGVMIAATDSYRLAEAKLASPKQPIDFLLPATAAADLLRIISDEEEVVVSHDDQQVSFHAGDVNLVARLIEGTYPDYRKLVPAKFATVAKMTRADLTNIVKVSSLFARESAGSITLKASKEGSQVSINAVASQLGENTAAAEAQVSNDGEVTLNSRYLIEALNAFSSDQIEFCFNGKLEPCVLRSKSEPDYTHLIMPLRS